jgi:hypothetical protein
MVVDKEGCVAFGSYTNKATQNKNFEFKNNIAAGCEYAGFVAPSIETCGGSFANYTGNVAHSSTRYGTYAYVNPVSTTSATCAEWGHWAAYKTQEACAVSIFKTTQQKVHHITCIDVQEGLSPNYGGEETEAAEVIVEDSWFFGESLSKDCPSRDACWC